MDAPSTKPEGLPRVQVKELEQMTQQAMWTTTTDKKRRVNQRDRLLQMLKDQYGQDIRTGRSTWLDRNWLEDTAGTHNFTARISELRGAGHVIENKRAADKSYYRYNGRATGPTTQMRRHCETCTCR